VVLQPCWRTRYSAPKAPIANWGTTSIALDACSRHCTGCGRARTCAHGCPRRPHRVGGRDDHEERREQAERGGHDQSAETPRTAAPTRAAATRRRRRRAAAPSAGSHGETALRTREPTHDHPAAGGEDAGRRTRRPRRTTPAPCRARCRREPDDPDRQRGQQQAEAITFRSPNRSAAGAPEDQGREQARGRRGHVGPAAARERPNWSRQVRHQERHAVHEGAAAVLRERGDRQHRPPPAGRFCDGGGGHGPTVRRRTRG
jgi:hypothetical protein